MSGKKQCLTTSNHISETVDTTIDTAKLLPYLQAHLPDEFEVDNDNDNDRSNTAAAAVAATETKLELYRFLSGYANPPFLMKFGDRRYVLRKDCLFPIANLKDFGFRCDSTLRKTYEMMDIVYKNSKIPVPKMLLFCEDKSIIGDEFYVMEFIEGRIIKAEMLPQNSNAANAALNPISMKDKMEMFAEIGRVLSLIHSFDVCTPALLECMPKYQDPRVFGILECMHPVIQPKLDQFLAHLQQSTTGTSNGIFDDTSVCNIQELCRVMQPMVEQRLKLKLETETATETATETETNANSNSNSGAVHADVDVDVGIKAEEEKEAAAEVVSLAEVQRKGVRLVHGDFHWENIIWHPTQNKIAAVVDWEGANFGVVMMDVFYITMVWSPFTFAKLFHEQGIKDLVEHIAIAQNEFDKHTEDRLLLRHAYAQALRECNPALYASVEHEIVDDENARFYEALVVRRFIAVLGMNHVLCAGKEEEYAHTEAIRQAFPIQAFEFMAQIGLCTLQRDIVQPKHKSIRVIDRLLDTFLRI